MVSLSIIRNSMFAITAMCKANQTVTLPFHYKGFVYTVTVGKTNKHFEPPAYRQFRPRKKRQALNIKTDECEICHNIMVAGICINKKCDSNLQPKPKT